MATPVSSTTFDGNVHAGYYYGDGSNLTGVVATDVTLPGSANHVAVFDALNSLDSEAQLANTRGGTGQNSSGWTGVGHVVAGTWSASAVVNADVTAPIDGTKMQVTGAANKVAIYDGTANLSSETTLATTRGGTAQNSSAATGFAYVTGGTWSFTNTPTIAANASSNEINHYAYFRTTDATVTPLDTYDTTPLATFTRSEIQYHMELAFGDETNSLGGTYLIIGRALYNGTTLVVPGTFLQKSMHCDTGYAATDVTVTVSGTDLIINVTGIALTDIRWTCHTEYIKQSF